MPAALPLTHALIGLAVVAVWGTNFVVIRAGLNHLPPLAFAALRFFFAAVPALLFVRRPPVPWSQLALYGLLIGAGQFGLLFIAMSGMISPGLASLVVQVQVFFTIGAAMVLAGETVRPFQVLGLLLACAGIAIIAAHVDATTTPLGLVLVVLAAACWAAGNMVARRAGRVNMVAYVVWSSVFAAPALAALALVFEGWDAISTGVREAGPGTWAAVLWQSVGNSLFGYAAWAWLLARHPAATVTPLALLVPVFGLGASVLLLGEPLPGWKIGAAALVIGGLAVGMLWPMAVKALRRRAG
ncbi:EamA family transporter [Alsobacter sp. SYSU M60028]|uniref:EamA family transporter n=1 Tax=Alsobacter ponti TaxID=2962936 RepID=A0ABT1LHA8_9HYPH|nr:EamA family transporter [Alsobacter ponti]MCP8940897.1 EamA family transporter [Alsobacter ponti]